MSLKTFLQKIPFWLKFAIPFTIVLFVVVIVSQVRFKMMSPIIFYVTTFPLYVLLNKLLYGKDQIIWLLILSPVYYFIIGSIIGLIIQVIKSKINSKQNKQ